MKHYEVRFTPLAEAFLGDFKSACEERVRGELALELPADYYPPDIYFHCFKFNCDDHNFMAIGKRDHILVDTASFDDPDDPIETGPMKGNRIQMPRPDSED
jgi:hypothetical protein